MAPQCIKVIYYDAKGRAEIIRLVLEAAGQAYENVIITEEDWKTEKPKTPFGQLPVVEIDGQRYGQSIAIATYFAREFGLYGKTNLDGLKIDQVIQLAADLLNLAIQAFTEKDQTKQAEKMKTFTVTDVPRFFGFYEKLLKESGTGFFVGKSLTLADFAVYDQVFTPSKWKAYNADGFPLLQALKDKVESHNKIKAYLATRKQTEM